MRRCTFPPPGTPVECAFSGGADSTALVILAKAADCRVTAIHVDHGLRPTSGAEAAQASTIARSLGVEFRCLRAEVAPGPNLEARARDARRAVLPAGHLTGHTADDQAETVLINLLRGAGLGGLAAMTPGPAHPILALRRAETRRLCAELGIEVVADPSNDDPRFVRNRIRAEVLPLLDNIAGRDVAALLARTSDVVRDDLALLDRLAAAIEVTDARALAAADPALARRALRTWLAAGGHPPDRDGLERAYAVAAGERRACELSGGIRLERSGGRLRIVDTTAVTSAP